MSRETAAQLARGFAVHLRHLREFRGLRYVGGDAMPTRGSASAGDVAVSTEAAEATCPEDQVVIPPPIAPVAQRSDPAIRNEITQPRRTVSAAPVEDPRRVHTAPVEDPRRAPASPAVHLPVAAAADGVRTQAKTWTPAEKLDYLRNKNIGDCRRCKLASGRKHIVFGVGDPSARLMFIGEAPGFDEDRIGEPFVGAAGKRLTQWISLLGMTREQVYIANVLKCRPPGNRDPEPDEVEKCSPFLKAQIRAIRPQVIVALGRYAGMLMTGSKPDTTLRSMRGRSWPYRDAAGDLSASLFVTYHPSYVIRKENELPPGQRNPADDTVMGDLRQAILQLKQS